MLVRGNWEDRAMPVDELLVQAAIDQANRRWPQRDAVAAAVRVEDDRVLTGVPLSNFNAAMTLCAETGPICTAYTGGQVVVASVCVSVDRSSGAVTVLAPCGACQERLALWGPEVEVGVADSGNSAGWSSRRLIELNPHYWAATSTRDHSWPTSAEHEW
jgi:cytidine deaminase